MRNVTCGGVILGCYDTSVYCYNDCHEDGATVIVWEWLRTWCLLAMRNVTCGCGGGVILGCYEDATVAEIWE